MVVGDLERYINHDELHHYDVVTYRYHDDNTQLFFHGQFTMVRISPATSMVWLGCEYFGGSSEPSRGLLYELRLRQFLHEREIRRGRSLPMPFHVADEGCMTRTFVSKKDLRIKYVPKVRRVEYTIVLGAEGRVHVSSSYTTKMEDSMHSWIP
eukprot:scaffold40265_cov39-Tisochrysis_lutea.AAC.4